MPNRAILTEIIYSVVEHVTISLFKVENKWELIDSPRILRSSVTLR
jgi:hypothetical protein